ncbi:MAG TPA: hypothetical protein DFR83_10780 [Deltaproteobacteria bacterium]|nr:hypothetical protein [Deltaproteobacteria bacterium]
MSAAPGSAHSVDVLRKGLIVGLLVGGVYLLHRHASLGPVNQSGLMALGFVVLTAYTIGELAEVLKLPHITGYLLAGLLLGPSAAHELGHFFDGSLPPPFDEGVLSERVIGQLSLLDTLALPLIALTAGGELHIHELRKGLKPILGVLLGQTVLLVLAFMGFAVAVGGSIPGTGLPMLSEIDLGGQLAVGAVLGALALATSAAATIAIILGVGAQGPMTRTVLSVVVLKDVAVVVLFAATSAAAAAALGQGGDGGLSTAFLHIGLSVVLGVAVGGVVHLYLRFIGVERLLFLVALIYTTAFLCGVLHAEIALVFIAAGFVVANFSDQGEVLIHDVERLSLPVFVVFFTLAGARLHIDVIVQMAGYAALLVVVRAVATWAGVRIGGQLTGADENTKKYGWMGMIAQAGLAISLAGQLPGLFPGGLGDELFALVLAGVAVHEVVGPAMLQSALSRAGEVSVAEVPAGSDAEEPTVAITPTDASQPPTRETDPWGPAYDGPSQSFTITIRELEADLRVLADTVEADQARPWARDGQAWVLGLRRAFLRAHRKALVLARDPEVASDRMVRQVEGLAQAWRSAAWTRAGTDVLEGISPLSLVQRVDQRLDGLPASTTLPVDPSTLAPREEPLVRRMVRAILRTSWRVSKAPRDTAVRDLWRYHVGGRAVGQLEGVVAPMVRTELDLARRLGVLFAHLVQSWPQTGGPAATEALERLRTDTLDALQAFYEQFDIAATDVHKRAHAILGGGMAQAKSELPLLGSIDLPHWVRRFSRVYDERNTAINALTMGLQHLRQTTAARHRAAGVEMEVATLQVTTGVAIRNRARAVGRMIEELGRRPLADADHEVGVFLQAIIGAHGPDAPTSATGDALAANLRQAAQPMSHSISETRRLLLRLADTLHESCAESVEQTIQAEISHLTEAVVVPIRAVQVGDWDLPTPVSTVELHLREGVNAWLDARVGAALEAAADEANKVIETALESVRELERVVNFNLDLAMNELDVFADAPPTPDTHALVAEMLQGAIGRVQLRVRTASSSLETLQVHLPDTIADTIPAIVAKLSANLVRGDITPLRRLTGGEARLRRELRKTAGAMVLSGETWPDTARATLRRVLGRARWEALQASWNHVPQAEVRISPRPMLHASIPVVYRRLFSEQVVSSVALKHDKSLQLTAASAVLAEHRPGRAVVVVAEDSALRAMLVDELARDLDGSPKAIRPADLKERTEQGTAPAIVEDLGQWIRFTPQGLSGLERLATIILRSHRAWILVGTPEAWRTAQRHTSLGAVIGAVVQPGPLSARELEQAILGRHAMSGMTVEFRIDDLLGFRLRRAVRSGTSKSRLDQRAWFDYLHDSCGGRLSDALRLWLTAITQVDEAAGRIVVGPIPAAITPTLDGLSDTDLLLLRRALASSQLLAEDLARTSTDSLASARGRCQRLAGRGLLEESPNGFRLPRTLVSPVRDQVRRRGWEVAG